MKSSPHQTFLTQSFLNPVRCFHVQPDLKVDLLSDYVIRRFGQESVCTLVDPHPLRKEDMSARLNAPDSKEWLILVSTRAAMQRSLAIDRVRTVIILDNEKDMQHEMEVRHAGFSFGIVSLFCKNWLIFVPIGSRAEEISDSLALDHDYSGQQEGHAT
jgi:hypothetical protein